MIKALIINRGMNLYELIYNNTSYIISINFIGITPTFKEADIFLDKSLLIDKSKLNMGPISDKYSNIDNEDLIKINTPEENYYLCRYYG